MNSPQETRLGHELRQLASGQPYAPDLAEIRQLARQRHRRGLALRGASAAGAAVLVAAGLFAAVHGTAGTRSARWLAGAPPPAQRRTPKRLPT